MSEVTLGRRAAGSAIALGTRQAIVQTLNIAGSIILARILSPGEFGVYSIALFALTFMVAFGDVGLAASLVRQKEEPTTNELRAVFTAQQALVLIVTGLVWLAAPLLAGAYELQAGGEWLFRLIAVAVAITSFQVIPIVRLERHLAFDRVAVLEVAQAVSFNGLVIILALLGWGVIAFGVALAARATTGVLLANRLSHWDFGWRISRKEVVRHLRFGLPYQGITFISLLKDSITPVFVGVVLGTTQAGYLNWAQIVAAYPVLALMVFQRLYLPVFSRLLASDRDPGEFVTRTLQLTNLVVAPLAIITLVLIEPITQVVFGDKWLVALPLFYLFWAANLLVPTVGPLFGLLNAAGRSTLTFLFALGWMLGTWALGTPMLLVLGPIGLALANLLLQATGLLIVGPARNVARFSLWGPAWPSWAIALLIGVVLVGVRTMLWPDNLILLALEGIGGLGAYAVVLLLWHREEVRLLWSSFRKAQTGRLSVG
jgi:O-antigen/teichoic acid export membrane protein